MADRSPHEDTAGSSGASVASSALPWDGAARPWRLAEELPLSALDDVPGVTRLAVQILHNRGVRGPHAVAAFLAADWRSGARHTLPDLERAAERLLQASVVGERVVVWGDYDCDGMTSCALLVEALGHLGVRAEPYVARREDDGRGLNLQQLPLLAAAGTRLIVTTDCGTANVDEVQQAHALGMDVIVTDHHPPHGDIAPAYAVVNPHCAPVIPGETRDTDLAGVAVAFRLAEALFEHAGSHAGRDALEGLLDLVAVGAIADVVPLTAANWALVRAGLARLNGAPRPGVRALLQRAELTPGAVTSRDIAFAVAPRLNAAGRLGSPLLAVRLLTTGEPDEAAALALEVEALHQERQQLTEVVYAAARAAALAELADDGATGARSVVIAVGAGWHQGILGLAAGRLAEEFHRPAFVISRDDASGEYRGSARAPHGVNLGALLAEQALLFRRFGGHAQAAGFTLLAADLPALLTHLRQRRPASVRAEDAAGQVIPVSEGADDPGAPHDLPGGIVADCRLPFRRLVPEVFAAVQSLDPYGPGFAEPVFVCPSAYIIGCWRSGAGGKTLRLRLREGAIERIAFWPRQGDLCEPLRVALPQLPPVAVVYSLAAGRGADANPTPRILTLSAASAANSAG
jgi:single-stranded-DNA-specific exonuclease